MGENENEQISNIQGLQEQAESAESKWSNALAALSKPIGQRSHKDIKFILNILSNSLFLQKLYNYNKSLPGQFANCVVLESFSKGKTIFMYGDHPDKFYFILKGKVSVLAPKTKSEISMLRGDQDINSDNNAQHNHFLEKHLSQERTSETTTTTTNNLSNKLPFDQSIEEMKLLQSLKSDPQDLIESNESRHRVEGKRKTVRYDTRVLAENRMIPEIALTKAEIQNWKQFFCMDVDPIFCKYHHIKFLSDGEIFGDFGLLVRKPRSASILAVQDTILLSMLKVDYEQLIREIQASKMEKRRKYFMRCLGLDESQVKMEWQNNIVIDFSTKIKMNQGWILFNEGDVADSIYLLKRGELEISREVKVIVNNDGREEYVLEQKQHQSQQQSAFTQSDNQEFLQNTPQESLMCDRSGSISNRNITNLRRIKLVVMVKGELVGLEDILQRKKQRGYSAKCITDVVLYQMKRTQLFRFLTELYPFKVSLSAQALAKREYHAIRIEQLLQNHNKRDSVKSNNDKSKRQVITKENMNYLRNQSAESKRRNNKSFSQFQAEQQSQQSRPRTSYSFSQQFSQIRCVQSPDQRSISSHIPSLLTIQEEDYKNSNRIPSFNQQQQQQSPQQVEDDSLPLKLTEPIKDSAASPSSSQLKQLEKEFDVVDMYQPVEISSKDMISSGAFWFDDTIKINMDNKIITQIKEKDPAYILKTRQTFKGNIEAFKYGGGLDKKIYRIFKTKRKLISQIVKESSRDMRQQGLLQEKLQEDKRDDFKQPGQQEKLLEGKGEDFKQLWNTKQSEKKETSEDCEEQKKQQQNKGIQNNEINNLPSSKHQACQSEFSNEDIAQQQQSSSPQQLKSRILQQTPLAGSGETMNSQKNTSDALTIEKVSSLKGNSRKKALSISTTNFSACPSPFNNFNFNSFKQVQRSYQQQSPGNNIALLLHGIPLSGSATTSNSTASTYHLESEFKNRNLFPRTSFHSPSHNNANKSASSSIMDQFHSRESEFITPSISTTPSTSMQSLSLLPMNIFSGNNTRKNTKNISQQVNELNQQQLAANQKNQAIRASTSHSSSSLKRSKIIKTINIEKFFKSNLSDNKNNNLSSKNLNNVNTITNNLSVTARSLSQQNVNILPMQKRMSTGGVLAMAGMNATPHFTKQPFPYFLPASKK